MFRTVFCAICFVLVLGFSYSGTARAANDAVFTVPGVKVDVTADNAAAAREEAFEQAQTLAFRELATKLMPEAQAESFTPPDVSTISTMIKDFEITDEQLSHVRYVGTYTFRFKGDVVRNYFGGAGVAYTDVSSKPVLIIPYFQHGASTMLWGNDNPWLTAWNTTKSSRGLVPIVVPIGDLQDVSDMGDSEALTYNPIKLAEMTTRYAAGEAIILLAVPEWDSSSKRAANAPADRLVIMVYRTDRGKPEYANKLTVAADQMGDAANIYEAGVKVSREALQKAWKKQTVVQQAEPDSRLKARVKFETLQEWAETQQKLRRVQGLDDMKLISLTQNEAHIELLFKGTEQRLQLALAQADMTLAAPAAVPYDPYSGIPPQQFAQPVYELYLNKYRHY